MRARLWSRPQYIAEANCQLSDGSFYKRLDHDHLKENQNVVKTKITEMLRDNKLPPSAKGLIVPTPQTSRFYPLPRIHKEGNPGRPIVSACCCPTENIAPYLDQIMGPLVRNLGTYVKDTNHALKISNDFHFNNITTGERFLNTMDIKSLYTVIPNNIDIEALAYFLNKRPVLDPHTSTLTRLAELVLTLKAFTFNGDFYQQISTTIYYKDTDTHTSLHHQSSHPSHCKKGLPRSQLSRLPRLCSEDSRFPGKGRWNGVFLWTTWILPRLVAERSPGHPTVRPDWCTKKSQLL